MARLATRAFWVVGHRCLQKIGESNFHTNSISFCGKSALQMILHSFLQEFVLTRAGDSLFLLCNTESLLYSLAVPVWTLFVILHILNFLKKSIKCSPLSKHNVKASFSAPARRLKWVRRSRTFTIYLYRVVCYIYISLLTNFAVISQLLHYQEMLMLSDWVIGCSLLICWVTL